MRFRGCAYDYKAMGISDSQASQARLVPDAEGDDDNDDMLDEAHRRHDQKDRPLREESLHVMLTGWN